MDNLLDQLLTTLYSSTAWLEAHILSWSVLAQCAVLIILGSFGALLGKHGANWVSDKIRERMRHAPIRLHASYRESIFLITAILMMWMSVVAAQGLGLESHVLEIGASLLTAWGVIRFTSSIIKSAFWARLVAWGLWLIAALNIVGLLDPVVLALGSASIELGDFQLSLLTICKGIIAFAILFWGSGFVYSLLEKTVDKSDSLTPSQKVLFNKLSRIFLIAAAIVIGLNIIGVDLTALTIFSGALGFGIGFGLQKVFSNLISGIILLMDKSVKPGDVIAIGETYGWVNALSARYVSVITRDGKEHLIPNENLIAEMVENWSYSHDHVRVKIPIGVSYHSDIHKARELTLEAAKVQPRVLENPQPVCLLVGFGDSSVNFELRVWISDPVNGVTNVKSAIYFAVWDLFQKHHIEIPFPQRDLHIKSLPEEPPEIEEIEEPDPLSV